MKPESLERVARRRLAGTLLSGSTHRTGASVVKALGAVQAQDFPGAKWALGMRASGTTDTSIQAEVDAGRILRTHVLRPTWHFVAPEDIRWMLALTGPRISRTMGYYSKVLGLTPKVFTKSLDIMARALEGGQARTRRELYEVLVGAKLPAQGTQRLARLVMEAETQGIVCSGPMRGKQFTYALIDERAGPTQPKERDEALLELTKRYFPTRGPATPQDFAWWSGLTVADGKRGIDMAGRALEKTSIDGRDYWLGAGARDVKPRPSAHLLPNYDEFFIGYRDRGAIGVRLKSVKAVTGGNALIAHIVVVDGQIVGGWRRLPAGPGVRLAMKVLDRLSRAERALVDAEVKRLERFLGVPVTA
jgi:hypothetical protein